jgi:hypothetical protein
MANEDDPHVVTDVHPHAHSVDKHVHVLMYYSLPKLLGDEDVGVHPEESSCHKQVLKPLRDIERIEKQLTLFLRHRRHDQCDERRIHVQDEKGCKRSSLVKIALKLLLPVEAVEHSLSVEDHVVRHHRHETVGRVLFVSISETIKG